MRCATWIPAKSNASRIAIASGNQARFEFLRGFDAAPAGAAEMGEDM
jgi:hypothetical protein